MEQKRPRRPVPSVAPSQPWFRREALVFLRGLARRNERSWFEARRAVYEDEVRGPMLALIERVTRGMEGFAPRHVRPPERILLRIHRDIRFSSDKRPYKPHLAAWWGAQGLARTSGGGFYLHLSGREMVLAAGVFMPDRLQLAAIRRELLAHAVEYRRLRSGRRLTRLLPEDEGGDPLLRSPRGFPAEHPAAPLYRRCRWGCAVHRPAESALDRGLAAKVLAHFRAAAPLVDFLNRPLAAAAPQPRRPPF
jgi:uncharacterized protein (TIGR02453 family)